jgi:hypothetical protein
MMQQRRYIDIMLSFKICYTHVFPPFSVWFFIVLRFPPSFSPLYCLCFLAHVVSSLAYPNLLGTKRLGCCCNCWICAGQRVPEITADNADHPYARECIESRDSTKYLRMVLLCSTPWVAQKLKAQNQEWIQTIHPFECFKILSIALNWVKHGKQVSIKLL